MRKKREYKVHVTLPEYRYNSTLISKFVCQIMHEGKKTVASKLVYAWLSKVLVLHSNEVNMYINGEKLTPDYKSDHLRSLEIVDENGNLINPENYMIRMFEKLFLSHYMRSVRIGGTTYRIPQPATPKVKMFKAMKLFRDTCRTISRKSGLHFVDAMFNEYKNIVNHTGESIKSVAAAEKTIQTNLAYANMFRKQKKAKPKA